MQYPVLDAVTLPLNVGTSVGRNAMVAETTTPYCLLLEDDHLCDQETALASGARGGVMNQAAA